MALPKEPNTTGIFEKKIIILIPSSQTEGWKRNQPLKITNSMKKTFLAGLIVTLSFGAMAQERAVGFVYEDLNGNGKKERREKGIEGVAVSNGVQVVQTDAKGRYELPIGDDQIIFVIKPSDYNVPVDENNLPQFFYIRSEERRVGKECRYRSQG